MGLTLGNPLTPSASASISINSQKVNLAGKCLSTGLRGESNDVVSAFLGNGLSDKALVLTKINRNITYSTNALSTAQNSLDKIAATLTDMLSVVAQSTGNSHNNRVTLNNILQKKLAQVELQTASAEFDGRKLLLGDLGSDPAVQAKFTTKSVSVKNLNNGTNFKAAGTKGVNTLTVGANTAAGEIIYFGGKQFKAVTTDPSNENEFKLGTTIEETARNLGSVLVNSSDEGLKDYTIDVSGATVVVTQIAATSQNIPLQGSANITNVITTAGTQGGINLAGIRDIEGFINSPTAHFSVLAQAQSANGDNAAKIIASQFGNVQAIAAASADGDSAAAFKVTIDGKEFTGAMFYANGGDMNDRVLTMTHAATGEQFTLETYAVYGGTGNLDTPANAANIASEMTNLFAQSRFNQTRTLKVNLDRGNIFDAEGSKIASMNGVSVKMTSTSFLNKKFTDFKVEDAGGGNVKLTAFVDGPDGKQEFTVTRTAGAEIAAMVHGFKLDLTDANTGDVISINLGESGLTALSEVKNHSFIAKAFKDSFLQVGSGLDVKVGIDFDDILNVGINDISAQKLFVDNAGKHIPLLSIVDESDAEVAQEVITNALEYLRNTQATVQTQIESIREASNALQSVIDITAASADSYNKADLIESSQMFSDAIKNILAAVSTIQAGNQISQAAQQLLQQL